jgi:restriction endonuclease
MELDYQLHRLGWKGFQQLCGTILRESMGQTLQTFSDVNDAGRDGAFHGQWSPQKGEVFRGRCTIQCKHSARVGAKLRLSALTSELKKAGGLGKKGLAENYLLFTNMSVTGTSVHEIETALTALPGISRAKVFGRD